MARYSDDMPRWFIDAKELWGLLIQQREKNKELPNAFPMNMGINQAVGLMNSLPAADVVEVIRCKDCQYWSDGVAGCTDHVKCCKIGFYMVGENGYCVYGKRGSDEN